MTGYHCSHALGFAEACKTTSFGSHWVLVNVALERLARVFGIPAMRQGRKVGHLLLEDGAVFTGYMFGALHAVAGEVVFNTGMVGYRKL
jgi:hypothetical protein